jgi:hypothetical protein
MDFVYICRTGRNEELRYSLRSIFQNTNVNNVWVVGGKPDWYVGNLRAIVNSEDIPNKFILMNDDFYITKPIDNIPVYHGGSLQYKATKYLEYRSTSQYAEILQSTCDLLRENGVQHPLDYSIHVPMTIHKENFEFAIDLGGAIRSVYGNMNRIGGELLPVHDVKVHRKSVSFPQSFDYMKNEFDIPFLSTSDITFQHVFKTFLRQYNSKSPVERLPR